MARLAGWRVWRRLAICLGICGAAFASGGCRHGNQNRIRAVAPRRPQLPDPVGIVIHDSDSPAAVHGQRIDAADLEIIHAHDHPGWATRYEGKVYHIGYHYVILPSGKLEQGRPDHCIGAHAHKHNNWLGICLVGAFSTTRHWYPERPTRAQTLTLIAVCEHLMLKYHITPDRVKRHRDVCQTNCPGGRFPYNFVLGELRHFAAAHPQCQRPVQAAARPDRRATR